MTQRFPTESLVNFPGVNDELEVGIVRSYNTVTNKYHIICPDETVKSFDASELQERVCVEGRVNDFPSEDGWDKYLSDVPKRATQLVDPGVLAPTNPDNNLRQRKAQAMLRVEQQAAKMIKEQIKAHVANQDKPKHHAGCIRAGMMEVREATNPILRWIAFVMAYANAFSKSFTDEFTLWVAKRQYWQAEMIRAATGANMSKPPLLFIIISKCSADDYCANMDHAPAHPHRQTLNAIRTDLESMYPGHHIILIDIPATLFGCKRGETKKGYKPCKTSSKAGLTVLKHIITMLITAAHACGIQVLGISSISATVDVAWIDSLLDRADADLGVELPNLLFDTVARYPRQRLKWSTTHDTIRGRGLHYVFMHMDGDIGTTCRRVTAWSLGVRGGTEATILSAKDVFQLRKLAFMLHDLAGAYARKEWLEKIWDASNEDNINTTALSDDTYEPYAVARQELVTMDFPDIDGARCSADDDDVDARDDDDDIDDYHYDHSEDYEGSDEGFEPSDSSMEVESSDPVLNPESEIAPEPKRRRTFEGTTYP